ADDVLLEHVRDEVRRMARRCTRALGGAEPVVRVSSSGNWRSSSSIQSMASAVVASAVVGVTVFADGPPPDFRSPGFRSPDCRAPARAPAPASGVRVFDVDAFGVFMAIPSPRTRCCESAP
ncbi:hypothetical protein EF908_28475, partial [Streptomyces sp. WAC04770]